MDEKKGMFDRIREINEQDRIEAEEEERKRSEERAERERQAREAYEKKLRQERIELMQMKQGIIEEKPDKKPEEQKKYTVGQKISSFFYLHKLGLIIGIVGVLIVGYLTYDTLTTVKADCSMMYTVYGTDPEHRAGEEMTQLFTKYTPDVNGDGKTKFDIIWMGIPSTMDADTYQQMQSSATQLAAYFQSGKVVLIVSSDPIVESYEMEGFLVDLTKRYPDNEHVKRNGFYLKGTKFAETLGLTDEQIPEDMFIGIRAVEVNQKYAEEMQKTYDNSIIILDGIVEELS